MIPEDLSLVQRVEFIREVCRGQRVLHLGCTNAPYTEESIRNGTLLHAVIADVAESLTGLDSDDAGLLALECAGFSDLIKGDLTDLDNVGLEPQFDVIIAGEIIEHLNDPGRFLSGIRRLMNPSTDLVITTVNAYCAMRFFQYGLRGKGGVNEPVHPDHVAYYSYSTLKLLLKRHNFELRSFYFYDLGVEHRPTNRAVVNLINDICVKFSRQWADGLVAICRKVDN
ncbi:MAG: methyltransferase domain-containing protein [Acidobacteriota bacterium]|nr:MAG: methyltransferase domain-containing protein [Acidobacteriota bacterium]